MLQIMDKVLEKCTKVVKLTSVEPTMWLYMMAFMTTSVIEQAFFVYKACRVDHGLGEEICRNITANKTLIAEVQVRSKSFLISMKYIMMDYICLEIIFSQYKEGESVQN